MQYKSKKLIHHLHQFTKLIIFITITACSPLQMLPTQEESRPLVSTAAAVSIAPATDTISSTQNLIDNSSSVSPSIIPPTSVTSVHDSSLTNRDPVITSAPLPPDYWMSLPIIPTVSKIAREISQHGIELSRNPHTFSKIGDCQSISTYFLKYFDLPGFYNLGSYSSLQESIDWFSGSFSRDSMSVKGGFNAAAILSPLRADPILCNGNENPIACEYRLNNPSIAIISLEEWWTDHPENYEYYLRQIIEYSIEQGVVPIIATKADNLEGNHLINQIIARLALEYDIPLWNFWLAVQPLPNHGLRAVDSTGVEDMFHLTHSEGYYFYNDPFAPQSGWSIRNLTALQALDAVRRGLINQP